MERNLWQHISGFLLLFNNLLKPASRFELKLLLRLLEFLDYTQWTLFLFVRNRMIYLIYD